MHVYSSRLNVIELGNLCEPEIEALWFLIKTDRLPRGINFIVLGTVYHPPQGDDRILRSHIFNSLDSLLATYPNSAIMLLGDFNQFKPANLCSSFKLKKLVTKPTRGNIIPWIKRFQPYYRIMNPSFYRLLHHLIMPVSFSNLRENRPQVYQQCDFINVIVEHPIRNI